MTTNYTLDPNHRKHIHVYLGLALLEFHKGMDYRALFDPIDKKLLVDIMDQFEVTSDFMKKVFYSCSTIRKSLNIISPKDFVDAMSANLQFIESFIKMKINEEIDSLYREVEELQLADFILPNRIKRIECSHLLTNIIAGI